MLINFYYVMFNIDIMTALKKIMFIFKFQDDLFAVNDLDFFRLI